MTKKATPSKSPPTAGPPELLSRDGPGARCTVRSGQAVLQSGRIKAEAAAGKGDPRASLDREVADEIESRARTKDIPNDLREIGVGNELVPRESPMLCNTVANPDYVTVDASRHRLELAHRAGTLEGALDAADSIAAQDSLENMLAHQLAVLHTAGMKIAARMEQFDRTHLMVPGRQMQANGEACRLAGALTRITTAYQRGLLTLQRKRSGGRQHITVTHVCQQDAGQTVAADKLGARANRVRGAAKNGH